MAQFPWENRKQNERDSRTPSQEQAGCLLKARGLDKCLEIFKVLPVSGDGLGFAPLRKEKSSQQAGGSGVEDKIGLWVEA